MDKTQWLAKSPRGRASACDRCHHRVLPDAPRLRVYDRQGPDRVRGKGSKASYLCTDCAWKHYGRKPPVEQEGLFD